MPKIIIVADLTLRTTVEIEQREVDGKLESPREIMDMLTSEGMKQYVKDYDPCLLYGQPDVDIVRVTPKRNKSDENGHK